MVDSDGVESYEDIDRARRAAGTTWVRATEASEAETQTVADVYGIHELELEDVVNNVRPKVESFDDQTFVLMKTATFRRGETTFEEEIGDEPLGIFFGEDRVVTLSTAPVAQVDRVWDRVGREDPRLLSRGRTSPPTGCWTRSSTATSTPSTR